MKAPRTIIREAVAARLADRLPAVDPRITAQRISIHRATPVAAARTPAVLIASVSERLEESPHADPGVRCRVMEMVVAVLAAGAGGDADAERIAHAVEGILDADDTLGGLVEGVRLTRLDMDLDADGDTTVLGLRMTYEVRYWTRPAQEPAGAIPAQVLVSWGGAPQAQEGWEQAMCGGMRPLEGGMDAR